MYQLSRIEIMRKLSCFRLAFQHKSNLDLNKTRLIYNLYDCQKTSIGSGGKKVSKT